MNHHITLQDLGFALAGAAGLVGLSWLLAGRKLVAPPATPDMPQTFVGSRLVPLAVAAFMLWFAIPFTFMGIDFLFYESDASIGGHWIRLGVGSAVLLTSPLLWWGVGFFGKMVIWADRLTLTEDGVFARLRGRERSWTWNQIADAKVRYAGRGPERLFLVLKEPDPDEVRRIARLPAWLPKKDPREIFLDEMWKPKALLTSGGGAACDAIKAILDKRRTRQPMTAQASG